MQFLRNFLHLLRRHEYEIWWDSQTATPWRHEIEMIKAYDSESAIKRFRARHPQTKIARVVRRR